LLVASALKILQGLPFIAKPLGKFFVFIGRGLKWFTKKLLLRTILKIYFLLLKSKKIFNRLKISGLSKYLFWAKKYVYKITIVLIIIIGLSNNLQAKSIDRENYGSQTLIASFLGDSQEQQAYLVKEEGLNIIDPSVTHYLEDQGALQNDILATPFGNDDIEGFLSITQGDSALIAPSLSDPDILTAKRDKIIEHTVQSGDSISTIAQQYGVSTNTILWENNLTWLSTIKPDQKLTVLPTSGLSHTVKSGDTVSAIAKKYQAEADDIIVFNKLADASDITNGEKLIIPNGVKPAEVQKVYKPSGSIFKNITTPAPAETGSKLLWPLTSHRMTQYFGWRHAGIDIGDHVGNPIYAADNGKVERAGWNTGYGYNLVIDHGNGIKTLYGHASKLLVTAGQTVSRGQLIAEIGSTGWSTGPHLHFEVIVSGSKVNPLNYTR